MSYSDLERSCRYATLVMETRPLTLSDIFCEDCHLQHVDCECNALTYEEVAKDPMLIKRRVR